jgi:hypothetical protein
VTSLCRAPRQRYELLDDGTEMPYPADVDQCPNVLIHLMKGNDQAARWAAGQARLFARQGGV